MKVLYIVYIAIRRAIRMKRNIAVFILGFAFLALIACGGDDSTSTEKRGTFEITSAVISNASTTSMKSMVDTAPMKAVAPTSTTYPYITWDTWRGWKEHEIDAALAAYGNDPDLIPGSYINATGGGFSAIGYDNTYPITYPDDTGVVKFTSRVYPINELYVRGTFHYKDSNGVEKKITYVTVAGYGTLTTSGYGPLTVTYYVQGDFYAPKDFTYSTNPATYYVGVAIVANTPIITGNVVKYSISPALPAGLVMDVNSGIITGKPTAVSPEKDYTVTASSNGGSVDVTLKITVQ